MTGEEHAKRCDEIYGTSHATMTNVEALWDLFCVATLGLDGAWVNSEHRPAPPPAVHNACCSRAPVGTMHKCGGCPLDSYGYRCLADDSPWQIANSEMLKCLGSGKDVSAYVDAKVVEITVIYLIYLSEGGEDDGVEVERTM